MPNPAQDTLTTEVKNALLQLLRSSLWGQERFPFNPAPDTDWQAVYTELCHQTVQHLPVDLLVAADPAHAMEYIQNAARNIQKWHYLMTQQQSICQMLSDAGIPCAVLKGAASASFYPQPDHRCMGDIDLIVRPEDYDRALALFQSPWKVMEESHRHADLHKKNLTLELHRKFSAFRSEELCKILDDMILGGIDQGETCAIERYTFPALPKKATGLVFLTHINSHMERGLGLRQMIDWMMYVDRELDDQFWQAEFQQAARQLGLEKLALTVTRMCQIYLGLREDITWCREADEALCAQLLEHTFRQGNFGRKLPSDINMAVSVFSTAKNIPQFFRALQRRGMITWPAAQKHPILHPFAWLYQIFRYIRLGFQKSNPIRYALQALRSEKTQGPLLEQLEVSRMNRDL